MEGYNKTEKNKINIITNDNIYDFEPVMENFQMHDDLMGDVNDVNMEGYALDVEFGSEKSLSNYIKYLWKRVSNIELTDLKVVVTTWNNIKLNEVLKKIKEWIGDITEANGKFTNSTSLTKMAIENKNDYLSAKSAIENIKTLYSIQNELLDTNVSRLKESNDAVNNML